MKCAVSLCHRPDTQAEKKTLMTTILIQFIKVRVATLTLNRPNSRNALSWDMRDSGWMR